MLKMLNSEKLKKCLALFDNEKFIYTLSGIFFTGGISLGILYLIILIDLKDIFGYPPAIAFLAYPFAIFNHSKKGYVKLASGVSLVMIFILFLHHGRFLFFSELLIGLGSTYILAASILWGAIGLLMPEEYFSYCKPIASRKILQVIFYTILVLTYFAVFLCFVLGIKI